MRDIWSSFAGDYVQAIVRNDNGRISGTWIHDDDLFYSKDGGHGMLFHTFDGRLLLSLHQPYTTLLESPCFSELHKLYISLSKHQ